MRGANQPRGVKSVGDEVEFALGFARIAGANLTARRLGHRDNGGGVLHGRRFCVLRNFAGAFAAAEEKADQIECGRQPFIAEVHDDGQMGKLLAQLFHQQNGGKRRHGDEDKVDFSLFHDAACGAGEDR